MTRSSFLTVLGLGGVLTVAAFIAANVLHTRDLLSVIPPGGTVPDVAAGNLLALYQAAFTAWVTLILLIPAFILVWFRNRSKRAWAWWLAFWTVSYLTYLLHLFISMGPFFGWDFDWMRNTSRVSAFWPGMVLILWWGLDVLLALRWVETIIIRVQRVVVHIGTFVLFFGGSAVKGELVTIQILGYVFLASGLLAGLSLAWTAFRR